jgi:hypothetical protein
MARPILAIRPGRIFPAVSIAWQSAANNRPWGQLFIGGAGCRFTLPARQPDQKGDCIRRGKSCDWPRLVFVNPQPLDPPSLKLQPAIFYPAGQAPQNWLSLQQGLVSSFTPMDEVVGTVFLCPGYPARSITANSRRLEREPGLEFIKTNQATILDPS